MEAYIEIRLLPDPEFPPTLLMNALFAKLHRALVNHGAGDIGVSFPAVVSARPSLGGRLRLHGTTTALNRLMQSSSLAGMSDHLAIGSVAPVPRGARFRTVRRVQAKSNPERIRRRAMVRQNITEEAARAAIPDDCAQRLDLPYVTLSSRSTGQQFRLFIEHGPIQDQPLSGIFSAYGLSTTATIPWF